MFRPTQVAPDRGVLAGTHILPQLRDRSGSRLAQNDFNEESCTRCLKVEIIIRTCFRDLYSNSIPPVEVMLSKDIVVPFVTKLDNFRSCYSAKQVRISGT